MPKGHAVLRDQLERAYLSIVLNIAEGAGRRSHRDKGRFYTIARGSAMESLALIDVLIARQISTADAATARRPSGYASRPDAYEAASRQWPGNGKDKAPGFRRGLSALLV